jgi:hypothetical protein
MASKLAKAPIRIQIPEDMDGISVGSVQYEKDKNGFIQVHPDFVEEHVPAIRMHIDGIERTRRLFADAAVKKKETTPVGQMRLLAENLVELFGPGIADAMAKRQAELKAQAEAALPAPTPADANGSKAAASEAPQSSPKPRPVTGTVAATPRA